MCVLGLMSTLCFEGLKSGCIKGTSMNITYNNDRISHVPTQPTSSQRFCHTDHKECGMSSLTFASVLTTKLLIGNIEPNPGPMNLKEFLAYLYTDAEDPLIKDVLNDFKAAQDKPTNLKKTRPRRWKI